LGVADDEDDLLDGVDEVDALQIHVAGTVSIVDLEFAYQDGIAGGDDVYGIAASTTYANATLTISYLDDDTENSTGLSVAYPFGPVTVEAYYSINDVEEDNWGLEADYSLDAISVNAFLDVTGDGADDGDDDLYEFGLEGSYDLGNGLEIFAGYLSDDGGAEDDLFYLAGEYDLGGGAELIVSYADDGDDSANLTGDEVGDPEYLEGTTVEVSFEF
jgi:predicted porin